MEVEGPQGLRPTGEAGAGQLGGALLVKIKIWFLV